MVDITAIRSPRCEISGFSLLSFCQNKRSSAFSVCILFEESVLIFQFLNDKIHNYVTQNIIVNVMIQKLKNKHKLRKISWEKERREKPDISHLSKPKIILAVYFFSLFFPAWSRCHFNWWHKIKSHEGIVQKIQAKQQFQHNNGFVRKSRGNFVESCGTLANFAKTFCSGSSRRCHWDWWFSGKENQWFIPTLLKIYSFCQIHSVEINY